MLSAIMSPGPGQAHHLVSEISISFNTTIDCSKVDEQLIVETEKFIVGMASCRPQRDLHKLEMSKNCQRNASFEIELYEIDDRTFPTFLVDVECH